MYERKWGAAFNLLLLHLLSLLEILHPLTLPRPTYFTIYAKKNGTRCENSRNSKSFLKNSDISNFDAQGREEFRKIGLVTLRLAIFEQYRLLHRFWG